MTETIDTLGKASRHNMLVVAECRQCRRQAKFLAQDLAHFYDHSIEPASLPFRCENCDIRDCEVKVAVNDRERRHEMVVWRPVKVRQG